MHDLKTYPHHPLTFLLYKSLFLMSNTYNLFIIMLNKHKKSIDFSMLVMIYSIEALFFSIDMKTIKAPITDTTTPIINKS